jgi:hypothetical protein
MLKGAQARNRELVTKFGRSRGSEQISSWVRVGHFNFVQGGLFLLALERQEKKDLVLFYVMYSFL